VGELADHLPAGAMLDEQGILTADPVTSRNVGKLDQDYRGPGIPRRDAAIDDPLVRMDFRRAEVQFVRVMVAGRHHARQDVLQLRLIVEQPQQRLSAGAPLADPEDVLGGRVEANNEQVAIEQDDARAQAVEDAARITTSGATVVGRIVV
jgi:hypothetical protein